MQTSTPSPPLAKWWHGPRAGYFGITAREYASAAKFSNAADRLGVKTTGITRGPFGSGCLLKLSGAHGANYEVHLDGNGSMLLGRVQADGRRTRLCEAGSNTEAGWERILAALRNSEGRP